ncbi:MAG: low affinity iron permease family protein [Alphaproteobacteria bacterium]|nr:low affinity iron permease family protein [Alphaproteobacteria bacterium]
MTTSTAAPKTSKDDSATSNNNSATSNNNSPTSHNDSPATGNDSAATGNGSRARRSFFTRFTAAVSRIAGRPEAFVFAAAIVVVWAVTGPIFAYSETWQLLINTGTTIITFLMVFVIQASQNRDTVALHLKIDELIRATGAAHNALLDIDNLDEEKLEKLRKRYEALASTALEEADIIAEAESEAEDEAPHARRAAAG